MVSKFAILFLVGLLAVVFVLMFMLNRAQFYVLGMTLVGGYLVDGVLYGVNQKLHLIKSYSTFVLIRCVVAGVTSATIAHFLLN